MKQLKDFATALRQLAQELDEMAVTPINPNTNYTSAQVRALANNGQILLVRDGAIVSDYGDTRVTATDYFAGLVAAFAAASAGDVIMCRGIKATGKELDLAQSNVKWLCEDVTITPTSGYNNIVLLNGADSEIHGLKIAGGGTANTGSGKGLTVNGIGAKVYRCEVSGTRGTTATDGGTLYCQEADQVVDGFVSKDAGYAGIYGLNANRLTLRNIEIYDPLDRGMNFAGSTALDWISLENVRGICDLGVIDYGGVGINWNTDGIIGTVRMSNVNLHNNDTAGNSYNGTSNHTCMKVQSMNTLIMSNCTFWHGDNSGAGESPSWRMEDPLLNPPPNEIYVDNCYFSDGFRFNGAKPKFVRVTNSSIGADLCSSSVLIYTLHCDDIAFLGCNMNMHAKTRLFTFSASRAATDRFRLVDCRLVANKATNAYIADANAALSTGYNTVAGNTYVNSGGGGWDRGADEFSELSLTTDHAGDMLFDGTKVGTGQGKHPASGSGPNYFSGLTCPAVNGRRVWNINWKATGSPSPAERAWIANAGNWNDWT